MRRPSTSNQEPLALTEIKRRVDVLESQAQSAESRLSTLLQDEKILNERIALKEQKVFDLDTLIASRNKQAEEASQTFNRISDLIKSLTAQKIQAEKDCGVHKENLDLSLSEYSQNIAEKKAVLQKEFDILLNGVEKLQSSKLYLEDSINILKTDLTNVEADITSKRSVLDGLLVEVSKLDSLITSKNTELLSLEKESSSLSLKKEEHKKLLSDIEVAEATLANIQTSIREEGSALQKAVVDRQKVIEEMNVKIAANQSIEKSIDIKIRKIEQLIEKNKVDKFFEEKNLN